MYSIFSDGKIPPWDPVPWYNQPNTSLELRGRDLRVSLTLSSSESQKQNRLLANAPVNVTSDQRDTSGASLVRLYFILHFIHFIK